MLYSGTSYAGDGSSPDVAVGLDAGGVVAWSGRGRVVVEAARSGADDWFSGEVTAEYEAYTAGQLDTVFQQVSLDQGEVQYCRARDGRDCWSIVFVDAGGAVVLPLAVGPLARAMKVVERLGEGPRLWDRSRYRPPSVIVGGRRHYFRPTKGAILVGVVEVGSCVLLLGAVGEELAVIRVEGKTRRALYVGQPDGFAEINVDRCLSLDEGLAGERVGRTTPKAASSKRPRVTTASPPEPVAKMVRASAKTEAQHRRILEGVAVDPDHARRVEQVLRCGFVDIARRAMEPEERAAKKLRGKRSVDLVLEMICELAIRGADDFGGRNGEIAARLRDSFPGRELTEHGLGHALRLILATGTCVLTHTGYTWWFRIRDLRSPASRQHRRFCAEIRDGAGRLPAFRSASVVPAGSSAGEREAPVLAVIDGGSAAGATPARSIVDSSQRGQAANAEGAPGADSPPGGPVVPVVAGQPASPAVAADAFTSGFNFGVLLCVLVLAGDDELGSLAGGPGGGTVSMAGTGQLGVGVDERVGDCQQREDTDAMRPTIAAGERGEVLVESEVLDQHGVVGEVNTAGTTGGVDVAHRRDALGSRAPPRSGT